MLTLAVMTSSLTTMPAMMTLRVHTESLRARTVMAFVERGNGGKGGYPNNYINSLGAVLRKSGSNSGIKLHARVSVGVPCDRDDVHWRLQRCCSLTILWGKKEIYRRGRAGTGGGRGRVNDGERTLMHVCWSKYMWVCCVALLGGRGRLEL